jgi:hypothetical protein
MATIMAARMERGQGMDRGNQTEARRVNPPLEG